MDISAYLMRLVLALVAVFGLLFGLRRYLLRRTTSPRSAPSSLLCVRERVWLSARVQVVVLDVGEDSFLICTTDHAVQMIPLAKLPELAPTDNPSSPDFATHLEHMFTFLRQGGKK